MRSQTNNVEASIEIIYEATSDIKEATVIEMMGKVACETCSLAESYQGGFYTNMFLSWRF